MKKLIAILGVSFAILVGLIAYASWATVADDAGESQSTEIPESITVNTQKVAVEVTPVVPSPIVTAEVVEIDEESLSAMEEQDEEKADESAVSHTTYEYGYSQLGEGSKQIYNTLYNAMVNYSSNVALTTMDTDTIDDMFYAVLSDHPEIFYVDGYKITQFTRGGKVQRLAFSAQYSYSESERDSIWSQLDATINNWIAGAKGLSDYEKVKYMYEYIDKNVVYDMASSDNQNIISVFLNGRSVCQGYAKAFQICMNRLGVPCTLATGFVYNGEGHAWNYVYADGAWYITDATWGDAPGSFTEGNFFGDEIAYNFLLVSDADVAGTHILDMPYGMPQCASVDDNYYVREGKYLTSYNGEQISAIVNAAYSEGKSLVSFKASDSGVYSEIKRELIDNQKIFQYLKHDGTLHYFADDATRTFTFSL